MSLLPPTAPLSVLPPTPALPLAGGCETDECFPDGVATGSVEADDFCLLGALAGTELAPPLGRLTGAGLACPFAPILKSCSLTGDAPDDGTARAGPEAADRASVGRRAPDRPPCGGGLTFRDLGDDGSDGVGAACLSDPVTPELEKPLRPGIGKLRSDEVAARTTKMATEAASSSAVEVAVAR